MQYNSVDNYKWLRNCSQMAVRAYSPFLVDV